MAESTVQETSSATDVLGLGDEVVRLDIYPALYQQDYYSKLTTDLQFMEFSDFSNAVEADLAFFSELSEIASTVGLQASDTGFSLSAGAIYLGGYNSIDISANISDFKIDGAAANPVTLEMLFEADSIEEFDISGQFHSVTLSTNTTDLLTLEHSTDGISLVYDNATSGMVDRLRLDGTFNNELSEIIPLVSDLLSTNTDDPFALLGSQEFIDTSEELNDMMSLTGLSIFQKDVVEPLIQLTATDTTISVSYKKWDIAGEVRVSDDWVPSEGDLIALLQEFVASENVDASELAEIYANSGSASLSISHDDVGKLLEVGLKDFGQMFSAFETETDNLSLSFGQTENDSYAIDSNGVTAIVFKDALLDEERMNELLEEFELFDSQGDSSTAADQNNAPVFKYSIDAFSFNLDDGIVFDASSALSFTGSENASFKFSYIYPNDAEDTSVQLETSGTDTNSWSYNGLEAGPIEPEYVFASSFSDENIVYNGFALAFNEAVETVFPDRIAFSFDEYNMTIETQSDFDNFVNFAASTDELPIQSLEQGVSHLFSELHNIDVTHPITVSGQLTVGSVLNATVADWIDPDGTSTSTFDYQWLRNGNAVSNANNTAYELTDNDLGSTISVSVRYIDDGGTAEEITSFTSEAVGTALIRDEHSNNAGWKFYTGTDGSDLVFGQSSSVYSSGAGDDTFVSSDDAEFQAFVGGLGTDQYIITKPGVMAVAEVNDGSTNVLSASGIGFTYDTTFVLTVNDGQHLIVEDTLSDQAVWLIDWDEGGFSSSKAILADGEYTAQFIAENLSLRPNYLGDFSWSELIEMGVDIPNDMPELIADAKQWALGADTSNAEDVTINLNDNDGTLTAAELETWVGLTGTAPAGSELTLVATLDVTGGVDEFIITTAANGDWSFTRDDINGIPYDGTYTLSLTARDASGTISGTHLRRLPLHLATLLQVMDLEPKLIQTEVYTSVSF